MPKFEMSQETGTVARWLKSEGETIAKGEAILEVETDKVTMEVESPVSGILTGITAQPGAVVPIGQTIAFVLKPGEAGAGAQTNAAARRATPVAEKMAAEHGLDLARISGSGKDGQITRTDVEALLAASGKPLATAGASRSEDAASSLSDSPRPAAAPAARRLAREIKLDLTRVRGSGPGGRIQSADVLESVSAPDASPDAANIEVSQVPLAMPTPPAPATPSTPATPPAPATPSTPATPPAPATPAVRRTTALTGLRKTIAQRMSASTREAPQFSLGVDVNMARALAIIDDFKASRGADVPKVTVTVLLVKLCAWALARNPAMNAACLNESIVEYSDINIGVAVALDDGLIVPVIHRADTLSLLEIAARLGDLSARARANKLGLNDIQGGTFSISNLGMFAVDRFTAIVNPPQAAILAVGRATKRIVADANDQPVAAPISTFTVSADHRAIDGAVVGRFLGDLSQIIEKPGLLL